MTDASKSSNEEAIAGSQSLPTKTILSVKREVDEQGATLRAVQDRMGDMQDALTRVAAFEMRAELENARQRISDLEAARKDDLKRIHSLALDRDNLEFELQANAARHRLELAKYRKPPMTAVLPGTIQRGGAPLHRPAEAALSAPGEQPRVHRPSGLSPMPAFTRVGPLDPARAKALLEEARAHMQKRDWAKAADAYAAFLSYQPTKAGPWKQFAHAIKEQGDLAGAERAYYRALALDASNVDTHIHLAHVVKNLGRRDDAAEIFSAALKIDPDSRAAREGLEFMGCPMPAVEPSPRERRRPSPLTRFLLKRELGIAHKAARSLRWEAAAASYKRLSDLDPANTRFVIQRGHALKELGRLDEAESLYRSAVDLEPLNSDAFVHLGHVLKLKGDLDGARQSYARAVRFGPDNQDALDEL